MRTNKAGRDLIKRWEGLKLEAYHGKADRPGLYTIGWGHTRGVVPGMRITLAQAEAFFDEDLSLAEADVLTLTRGIRLSENEFAALVSFCFNVGADIDADKIPEGLGDSTLLAKLLAGDRAGAAHEFPKWKHSNGAEVAGLIARRAEERTLFLRAA